MPGIKKRKKSAHMARHDRGLQDTPDGLAVMVTALPSYTKARRDNRCPLPPLPAGRLPGACPLLFTTAIVPVPLELELSPL